MLSNNIVLFPQHFISNKNSWKNSFTYEKLKRSFYRIEIQFIKVNIQVGLLNSPKFSP